MSRVKFVVTAIMGFVVVVSSADIFAQDCCCDSGARSGRVGIIARMRARRSTYTNNCCQAPAQNCCQATPVQTSCCPAPAPCCQTACCTPAPTCGGCDTCHASTGCCNHGGGLFANRRANRDCNSAYTSTTSGCCGQTMGCSGCAGCANGQIMQGSSQGVIVPEASGQPVAPEAPTPSVDSTKST